MVSLLEEGIALNARSSSLPVGVAPGHQTEGCGALSATRVDRPDLCKVAASDCAVPFWVGRV